MNFCTHSLWCPCLVFCVGRYVVHRLMFFPFMRICSWLDTEGYLGGWPHYTPAPASNVGVPDGLRTKLTSALLHPGTHSGRCLWNEKRPSPDWLTSWRGPMSGRIFGVQKYPGLKNREWVILMLTGLHSVFGPKCWKHRLLKILLFIIALSYRDRDFESAKTGWLCALISFPLPSFPSPLDFVRLPFSRLLSSVPPPALFTGCVSKMPASLV